MILDAFDPGPLGDFPSFPRSPDGTPLNPPTRLP